MESVPYGVHPFNLVSLTSRRFFEDKSARAAKSRNFSSCFSRFLVLAPVHLVEGAKLFLQASLDGLHRTRENRASEVLFQY